MNKRSFLAVFVPITLLFGCSAADNEKAHLGEEACPGLKVGQKFKTLNSGMRAIETEICTDIEAYDIHQKVISEIAKKNLGAVMAEGDIATSGRLLPLAIDDTIAVLYSDDKNAKDKEIVRVKILSTRMQGTEGKAGWIKVQILNDRSLFSPID